MNTIFADRKTFSAKILLFGEYSIISGGAALTIPFHQYYGQFAFQGKMAHETSIAKESNLALREFSSFLQELESHKKIPFSIDVGQLKSDLENGMYFHSNIPQGYGAGSSGAVVAAIFAKYSDLSKISNTNISDTIPAIRAQFSLMESWFHGSSSGLDPLSCLLAQPLLVNPGGSVLYPFGEQLPMNRLLSVFLIDTGAIGKTRPLVDWFKNQVASRKINDALLRDLSNETIRSFIDCNLAHFNNYLPQLSLFQLENMPPMIPPPARKIWEDGLQNQLYTLKLCGSGGGGFLLGFTHDLDLAIEHITQTGFRVIKV